MKADKSNSRIYVLSTDTDTQGTQTLKTQGTQTCRKPDTLETHETQETHRSLSFLEVKSVSDGVAISIAGDGDASAKVWNFCGAMKSLELTSAKRLSVDQLREAFFEWWNKAVEKCLLDPKAESFEICMLDFLVRFTARKTPLGSSTIQEAMRRARDASNNPKCAGQFSEETTIKLLRLVMHLQDMAGDAPFSLSVRDAAVFMGVDKTTAGLRLRALRVMGLLQITRKGSMKEDKETGKRLASEYRFRDRVR